MIEGNILPKLILIGDGFTSEETQDRIARAVEGGVRWVHLRDHAATDESFNAAASSVLARLGRPELLVSINARLPAARELDLHFHTGSRGPHVDEARRELGPRALIGFSAHDSSEADEAIRLGADYLFFSPVFETSSKPGHAGLEGLRAFSGSFREDVPVFALGGITPERIRDCLDAGAYGVAVLSGLLEAEDPKEAARSYVAAVDGIGGAL